MPKPHVHREATAPTVNGVRSSLVKRLRTPHDDRLPPRSASSLEFVDTGSRWLGRADMKPLVNEFWVRPSASETPVNAIQFERASYF